MSTLQYLVYVVLLSILLHTSALLHTHFSSCFWVMPTWNLTSHSDTDSLKIKWDLNVLPHYSHLVLSSLKLYLIHLISHSSVYFYSVLQFCFISTYFMSSSYCIHNDLASFHVSSWHLMSLLHSFSMYFMSIKDLKLEP